MSLETLVNGLTLSQKLEVMELIWRDLSQQSPEFPSPAWHAQVLAERENSPESGEPLGIEESFAEIRANLNARKAQS